MTMKRTLRDSISVILLVIPVAFSQQAVADETMDSLCQAKAEEIQTQRRIAEEHGNEHRVRGLKKAMEGVQRHCTNEGVLEDAEEDISENMAEVKERQEALSEAQREGDADDIRQHSEELEDAVMELRESQDELESLQGEQ